MKWQNMRPSKNVRDKRGESGGFSGGYSSGGMGIGRLLQLLLFMPGKSKWIILLLLAFMFFGGGNILGGITDNSTSQYEQKVEKTNDTKESNTATTSQDEGYQYMAAILGNTEDFWTKTFEAKGQTYHMPQMELYTGTTKTAGCGFGTAQAGPFYCPADSTVYIDLSFMDDLNNRYNAPGDFAMAYVISHEVGHHIQKELGIMDEYNQQRAKLGEKEANKLNVRLELQADYFAGAWSKYANDNGFLEVGDIDEAIQAAYAVGDDTIQKEAYGTVVPDSFTHGSAQQRQAWFRYGYEHGDIEHSDTFNNILPEEE